MTFEFSFFQAVLKMYLQIAFGIESFATFGAPHVILFVMNFWMTIELKFGQKWFAAKFTSLLLSILVYPESMYVNHLVYDVEFNCNQA